MPRKTLNKGTSVAAGHGHDLDKLYADLNEMLAEIYANKPDVVTDANGNTLGIKDASGITHSMLGSNIMTIGAGGRFSNLTDAFAERAAQGHTLLATFTGSVTGTSSGTVPVFKISRESGDSLTAYRYLKNIGVRIGGSGPIVAAYILDAGTVITRHPIPQDYASQQIDVYVLKWGAIALLPGTVLEETAEHLHIPSFTTLCALVPRTATIIKTGSAGLLFAGYAEQNEVHLRGLNLVDAYSHYAGGSWFWNIPTTQTHANQVLCDYSIFDCNVQTDSQDFAYFGNPNIYNLLTAPAMGNSGGFTARGNDINGRFDLFYIGNARHIDISGNTLNAVSLNVDLDGGNPCGVAYGPNVAEWTYPIQRHFISNNTIRAIVLDSPAAANTSIASGVEVRNGLLPSNLHMRISGNQIHAEIQGGDGEVTGFRVGSGGTTTPSLEFVNNSVYAKNNGGGTVTATIATSSSATSVIKTGGNTVPAGGSTTLGTNAAAATTY